MRRRLSMPKPNYFYYYVYAEDLLNTFIQPIIDKIIKNTWSTRGISIVLDTNNDITEEDIDCCEHSIFTVYHDNAIDYYYSSKQVADYFVFSISSDSDIETSNFVFEHHCNDDKANYDHFTHSAIYRHPQSFEEVSKVIEVLKQLILDKYSNVHNVNIYTEKEYQIQKVSKLYAKIAGIKNEYNLNDTDLANAKANCKKWLRSI